MRNRQCAGTRAAHQQLFVKFKVTQSPIYRLRAVTSVFNLLHTRNTLTLSHIHTHTRIHTFITTLTIKFIQKCARTHEKIHRIHVYSKNYHYIRSLKFFSCIRRSHKYSHTYAYTPTLFLNTFIKTLHKWCDYF